MVTDNYPEQRRTDKRKSRTTQQEKFRDNNSFPEKSRGFNLQSLLDRPLRVNLIQADNQPDIDPEIALRLKQKKKRRRV
jgi:hypothetical protein